MSYNWQIGEEVTSDKLKITGLAYLVDIGSANTYVANPQVTDYLGTGNAYSSYVAGMAFTFIPANTNTGASTLNINGIGAVAIVDQASEPLQADALEATIPALVVYNGTNFVLITDKGNFEAIFGDGSDGDVTISSNTSLSRDMFYNNLTINNGFTLNPNGYRIFVKSTLTVNGIIARNGNNGGNASGSTAGTAGSALSAGTIFGSVAGVAGASGLAVNTIANGNAGNAGTAAANSVGVSGSAGGTGGGTPSPRTGGAGGAGGVATATINSFKTPHIAIDAHSLSGTSVEPFRTSASGGSGGSGSKDGNPGASGAGGGSGSSGGLLLIVARKIIISATGAINAIGGNGGNGGNAGGGGVAGGGGGGAGGSGGVIALIYNQLTNSGSISVAGGTAGTGGTGEGGGSTGSNGSTGTTGLIYQFKLT